MYNLAIVVSVLKKFNSLITLYKIMAIGKTLLIVGAIILVIGIALFFFGGYMASSSIEKLISNLENSQPLTINPHASISLGVPSKFTLLIYNTSLGKPIIVIQNINGTNKSVIQASEDNFIIALLNQKYEAFMINNFSQPITVKYVESYEIAPSLINVAIYTGFGFFLGIVGVIILIVGIILYFVRKR